MMRLVFILLIWIIAYYSSDWGKWKRVHPTILFMIAANFFVGLITYNYTLWDLSSELGGHIFNDFLLAVFFFPPALLIFFSHYPFRKKIQKQLFYLLIFVSIFTGIEVIQLFLDNIHYENGWNLWKSFLINISMFIVIRIHYSKPILAYVLYLIEILLLILITHIPISQLK